MELTEIKSMCLQLALGLHQNQPGALAADVLTSAKAFEDYLTGK